MKYTQYSALAIAIAGASPAFSFVSPTHNQPKTPATPLDATASLAADASVFLPAAGAAVAALGVAFGFNKVKGGTAPSINGSSEKVLAAPESIDVSIPYDATSVLAFEAYKETYGASNVDFDAFSTLYKEQMVAEVKAKVQERKVNEMKAVLESMENDAASIQGKIVALFEPSTADAGEKAEVAPAVSAPVETVVAASTVDLSIDYDSAAKLAYEQSDKSVEFDAFRETYVAETVAMVTAKKVERDSA